jgi:hypothetical protein
MPTDSLVALSFGLALALSAGCGGEGGVRRMRAEQPIVRDDAGICPPPFECDLANVKALDCAAPAHFGPDGHVTDFSCREWSSSSGKWCSATNGYHGSTFSFKGTAAGDANAISVNTGDGSLRLALTVSQGSYGGGGLAFEGGCVDASAFTGVEFSVAVTAGSIAGCTYQLQLQTFEQRPMTQNPPGGCDLNTTSCYGFPAEAGLPTPSTDPTMPTLVTIPFSSFSASVAPAPAQLVGLQWQVNSSSGACTVELRLDDIRFIPAAASL